MAENSKIEWTRHTFNPWIGCTKVHEGCDHCYAEAMMDSHYGKVQWGPNGTRKLTSDANWKKPLKWDREAKAAGRRDRVFCASLADVFEDWSAGLVGPKGWPVHRGSPWHIGRPLVEIDGVHIGHSLATMQDARTALFSIIDQTPNLIWLVLTKRPENARSMLPAVEVNSQEQADDRNERGELYRRNLWIGTSVSKQEHVDKQVPELLKCRDFAAGLFLSCEPLLGPVDLNADGGWLVPWERSDGVCGPDIWNEMYVCGNGHAATRYLKSEAVGRNVCLEGGCGATVYPAKSGIDWVIVGGESGSDARPMCPEWARSLRNQCELAGTPFFFKQWGEFIPLEDRIALSLPPAQRDWVKVGDEKMVRVGKKAAGRMLDGREWSELPAEFAEAAHV